MLWIHIIRSDIVLVIETSFGRYLRIHTCFIYNKFMVGSHDGDTDFFDRVLQEDTEVLFQYMIKLDYVPRTSIHLMKENSFTHKKTLETDDFLINYYWCRMCRKSSTSCKYTYANRICYIAWSRHQEALVSMWTQIKQSSCVLIKMVPSPHKMSSLWTE